MIKTPKPQVTIGKQALTESPQTGATAIMDDTVYTMDDPRVMMGGQVTIYPNIGAKTVQPRAKATIRKRR